MRNTYIALAVMAVLVVIAIVYGFMAIGSPWDARGYALDQTRLSNFSSISSAVQSYAANKHTLPDSLNEVLETAPTMYGYGITSSTINDPGTGQPYDYQRTDASDYQLCATFYASSAQEDQNGSESEYFTVLSSNTHPKGYDCISYQVASYLIQSTASTIAPVSPSSTTSIAVSPETPLTTTTLTLTAPTDVTDGPLEFKVTLVYAQGVDMTVTNHATGQSVETTLKTDVPQTIAGYTMEVTNTQQVYGKNSLGQTTSYNQATLTIGIL